jgi:hypothetical protein
MSLGTLSCAKLPREVKAFVNDVREFLSLLDVEMKKPSNFERGKRIAQLASALEMSVDRMEHFGIHGYPAKEKKREAKFQSGTQEIFTKAVPK